MIDDLTVYRSKFNHVDTTNPASLKAWFHTNRYLNIGALAAIAKVPRNIIRKWQKLAGIGKRGQYNPPKDPGIKPINLAPPPPGHHWCELEWLTHAWMLTRSTTAIAKVAGVSHKRVEQKLKKLKLWEPRPPHPCNNIEWLKAHYINSTNSVTECARIAGVTDFTVFDWLARAGIVSHSDTQVQYARRRNRPVITPIWFKALASKLREMTDIVKRVSLQELGMIVKYKTGILEIYYAQMNKAHNKRGRTYSLDIASGSYTKHLRVHRKFQVGFNELEYPHFVINRKDWEMASLIERRVALHRFQLYQRTAGLEYFKYPSKTVSDCYQWLCAEDTRPYTKNNVFRLHSNITTARWVPLIFTYFKLDWELFWFFQKPRRFFRELNSLSRRPLELNTENLLRLACKHYRLRLSNPVAYRAIFAHLGINSNEVLLDLHPGYGFKAIAVAMIGAKYRTLPVIFGEAPLFGEFAQFLQLDWCHYNGEQVDVVFADNGFRATVDIPELLATYSGVARRIVGFVQASDREVMELEYKPKAVVGVRTTGQSKLISHFFIW